MIHIVAMLSLESVGFYTDTPHSQTFPAGLGFLYSSTGNVVAFYWQPELETAGTSINLRLSRYQHLAVDWSGSAQLDSRSGLVGSLVLLAAGLPRY
jgi:hypothetical protein